MNSLPTTVTQGAFAEILVQLLLLKYEIQAAPPIKDSGNDLIAICGEEFRAIQVKSFTKEPMEFKLSELPNLYHILALVRLDPEANGYDFSLEKCRVFLLKKEEVAKGYWKIEEVEDKEISKARINYLFNLSPAVAVPVPSRTPQAVGR